MSGKTLSKYLNIDEAQASLFIETFKATFSGLKNFISEQIELCRKQSYVETVRKRKRYLPDINSTNIHLRAQVSVMTLYFGFEPRLIIKHHINANRRNAKQ
jgi:DNA polymerase I-like protein with 3'-5' exonuclease and polymerase domains